MAEVFPAAGFDDIYVPGMGLFFRARKIPVESGYARLRGSPRLVRNDDWSQNAGTLHERWGVKGQVYVTFETDRTSFSISRTNGQVALDEYDRPLGVWGSGTDCIGFAQQSASYAGNTYLWSNLNRDAVEDAEALAASPWHRVYPRAASDVRNAGDAVLSDFVVTRADVFEAADELEISELLSRIRPGDIMYYGSDHIAVVQQVEVNEEGLVENLESVKLIESVFWFDALRGVNSAKVTNERNLATIHNAEGDERQWRVVRLRSMP